MAWLTFRGRRGRAIALATLASLLVLGSGRALAQSGSGNGGLPEDIRAVSTVLPLRTDNGDRALAVYRALIPNGLSMPAHPVVGVWLSQQNTGRYIAGRPMDAATDWIEGAIEIRIRHGSEEGWYPILYPVTAEFWFQAGRAVGLPKRHATASITPDGPGWVAQATMSGTSNPGMYMDWQPGPNTDPAAVSLAFRAALDPLFTLNPALQGPDLERVQYLVSPPSPAQTAIPGGAPPYANDSGPTPGIVHVRLAPDTDAIQESDLPKIFPPGSSLADVINPDQTVPGDYYFYAVNLSDTSGSIGTGGYAPRQPVSTNPPAASSNAPRPGSAIPSCIRRRAVVLRLGRRRLRLVRAYVDGRRAGARILRHGRMAISLIGLPPGSHELKVVASTSGGRTLTHSYRFRNCSSHTAASRRARPPSPRRHRSG